MKHFLNSIENALEQENWLAALFISITLPDICGLIETQSNDVGERYRAWYKKYMSPSYDGYLDEHDAYNLRCKLLHQGVDTDASSRLDEVGFTVPVPRQTFHLIKIHGRVQLQVDIFCRDMCAKVREWMDDTKDDGDIKKRLNDLFAFYDHITDFTTIFSVPKPNQ